MSGRRLTLLSVLLFCAAWVVAQHAPAGGTAPGSSATPGQASPSAPPTGNTGQPPTGDNLRRVTPPRRQPAQPHLRPRRDRIQPIQTRRARNLPRRIRIIRTPTLITRAQTPTEIPMRRGRQRIRARQVPAPRTQGRTPAPRIRVPTPVRVILVRVILVRRTQHRRIRQRGTRLRPRRLRAAAAHRRSKSRGDSGPERGPPFSRLTVWSRRGTAAVG
jgi:hypothetical protein